MFKVTGSASIEVDSDGSTEEQQINGSEFSLEEDGWRNLGDGDRQYEALFVYHGEEFQISFQATYLQGKVTCYELAAEGSVKVIDEDIGVEYIGSGNDEDDYENYQ